MNSNLTNLISRRDLLRELVLSELRASSAETKLGWLWWFLDPLLHMLIYWAIVVGIFGRGRAEDAPYPVFLLFALITWKHFASAAGAATNVLRSKESLIKSVPFPTMVLPLAQIFTGFGFFLAGFAVVMIAALLFPSIRHEGNYFTLIQLPALFALQVVVVTGLVLPLACFGALLRDLSGLIVHFLRIGFYLSPGLYSVEMVREALEKKLAPDAANAGWFAEHLPQLAFALYMMNPFAILIHGYRKAVFFGEFLEPQYWVILTIEACVFFILGYRIFQHYDRRVIKFL